MNPQFIFWMIGIGWIGCVIVLLLTFAANHFGERANSEQRNLKDEEGYKGFFTEDDLPGIEKALQLPAGRLGTPRDLGAAALYLLSPATAWVTGQVVRISGGG